jgi:hypothetical protein
MGEKSVLLVNKRESYCLRTAHFPSCVALARLTARHRSGATASPPDSKENETWPFLTTPYLRKLTAPRSLGEPPRGYQRSRFVCQWFVRKSSNIAHIAPCKLFNKTRPQKGKELRPRRGPADLRMAPPCAPRLGMDPDPSSVIPVLGTGLDDP